MCKRVNMRFIEIFLVLLLVGCANPEEYTDPLTYQELTPIERVFPKYPKLAVESQLSGFVVMTFNVNQQGHVTDITVVESNPEGVFDEAAVQALSKWKYGPLNHAESVPQKQKLEFKI